MLELLFIALLINLIFYIITASLTIYSLLYMVIIYFIVFILLIKYGLDLIALFLLLIYIGSILILFVFAIFFSEISRSTIYSIKKHPVKSTAFLFRFLLIFLLFLFISSNMVYFYSDIDIKSIFIINLYEPLNFNLGGLIRHTYSDLNENHFLSQINTDFYYIANYYIDTYQPDYTSFNFSQAWRLGSAMYSVYFVPILLCFIMLFISILAVTLITYSHKYNTNSFFKIILFKFRSYRSIDILALSKISTNLFTNNYDYGILGINTDNIFILFFTACLIIFFTTAFLLFSEAKLTLLKIIIILELYLISILLFLCYFSVIHGNYDGIVFAIVILGLMAVEAVIFLSILSSFKSDKKNFSFKKKLW